MKNLSSQVDLINQLVSHARELGIGQVKIQDQKTNGRTILVDGKEKVYFGNCSYLGIELDERVKRAAIEAINNYGICFSCSRTYAEIPLFEELETLLSQMFGKPTIVAPTTTLGHMANIPILIRPDDAVILDHQVHASIQSAVQIVKGTGTYVEIMRHGRMDMLESRIKKLKEKHNRIWYMTDGVYSMMGDGAPLVELYELMNQYEQLHCYVDDAHGMSWNGKNGTGYALSKMPTFHERLFFIASLAKGYGACGAVLVYPNHQIRDIVKNCGPTLMFSGPPQPATIAAGIAAAQIHLSSEIYERQQKLMDLVHYYAITAKGLGLPLINDDKTPIFFIGVGTPETGFEISKRMMDSGFLLNLSAFPSMPYKNTGLRTTLTTNHTVQDIYEMLSNLAEHLEDMERKQKVTKREIFKAFALAS